MIANRLIDDKVMLRDLLAQAVCMGVRAGRGDIDYTSRGPWHIADEILSETPEMVNHRNRILGLQNFVLTIASENPEMLNPPN